MTRRISFKSILIGFLMVLTLFCIIPNIIHATDGAGDSGGLVGGTKQLVEGCSAGKTGWLISIAKEDGTPIDAVFVTTTQNPVFTTTGVAVDTSGLLGRWGATYSRIILGCDWHFGPFSGSTGRGNGRALKQWLLSPHSSGVGYGSDWILKNYFNYSDDQIAEFSNDPTNRLICEGVMWSGEYVGSDFQGKVYVGTSTTWAHKDINSWVSIYTHQNLPNSHYLDVDNFITGIGVPSDVNSKHDAGTICAPLGYGAVAIRPKEGINLIQVFRTDGVVDNTSYTTCSLPYQVKDIGDYKVQKWFLSNQTTTERGNKTDYPVFQSQLASIASGNGPGTVAENKKAQTLVILYERVPDLPNREEDEDAMLAWENDIVFERYVADRSGETDVNNSHVVYEDIMEVINDFASQQYVVIDSYEFEEEYTVNASLGNWQTPIWNLYNSPVQYGLWDTYNKAIGSNVYSIYDEVDPQFSYYLVRSLWERLAISPDREGQQDFLSMITSPKNGYPTQFTGLEGLSQTGNTEILRSETRPYNYQFTTTPINIYIEYHLEIPHEAVLDEYTGEVLEEEWTEVIEKPPHDQDYTFTIAQGSTGDNKTYKYKAKTTPIANSGYAGTVIDELKGDTFRGTFAKSGGETFEYIPLEAQSVASEFRGQSIKIYPEVMMTVWRNSSALDYIAYPKEYPCYVMGEFKREFTPPITHGYVTTITSGSTMSSSGSLMTAATGHTAQTINSQADTDLGVTSQGTAFSVNTLGQYVMHIYSVAIHPSTSSAHGEWGNELTQEDVVASHEAYVESLLALTAQELVMEYEFKPSGKKLYMTLLTDENELKVRATDVASVDLFWHDGGYDERDTVVNYCKTLYPFTDKVYNNGLNLDYIFDTIFISNNDGVEDNASTGYTGTGENGVTLNRTHWYDEESQYKISATMCHTEVTFSQIGATDKTDFNVLTSSVYSSYLNQSDYINVKFYNRLYMDLKDGGEAATRADGFTWPHTGTFRVEHLINSDFAVINKSTADMKK